MSHFFFCCQKLLLHAPFVVEIIRHTSIVSKYKQTVSRNLRPEKPDIRFLLLAFHLCRVHFPFIFSSYKYIFF